MMANRDPLEGQMDGLHHEKDAQEDTMHLPSYMAGCGSVSNDNHYTGKRHLVEARLKDRKNTLFEPKHLAYASLKHHPCPDRHAMVP